MTFRSFWYSLGCLHRLRAFSTVFSQTEANATVSEPAVTTNEYFILKWQHWSRAQTYPIRIIIGVHHGWLRIVFSVTGIRDHKRCSKWLPLLEVLLICRWTKFVLDGSIIGSGNPKKEHLGRIIGLRIGKVLVLMVLISLVNVEEKPSQQAKTYKHAPSRFSIAFSTAASQIR